MLCALAPAAIPWLHTCSGRPAALLPRVSNDRRNGSSPNVHGKLPAQLGMVFPRPYAFSWCVSRFQVSCPQVNPSAPLGLVFEHRPLALSNENVRRVKQASVPRFIFSRFIHLGLLSWSELLSMCYYKLFRIAVRDCVITLLVHLTCVQYILSALPYATATDGTPARTAIRLPTGTGNRNGTTPVSIGTETEAHWMGRPIIKKQQLGSSHTKPWFNREDILFKFIIASEKPVWERDSLGQLTAVTVSSRAFRWSQDLSSHASHQVNVEGNAGNERHAKYSFIVWLIPRRYHTSQWKNSWCQCMCHLSAQQSTHST
ncbi:hypothetical protein EDB86DRAFT_2885646 [Lactarius hatsudake]|nr:hypothetical protein EDB86DRAFT_2885646 [Lactarius hatsudake]